jgi:ATP phosphoribosyltransferase regulatory subunit HisZ
MVIDTDVFSCVFNPENSRHQDYAPVFEWIDKGPGDAVYGGTTYRSQLGYSKVKVLEELGKRRRAKLVNDDVVDSEEEKVKALVPRECDDTHLIAIFRASGCRLLCSGDKRADKFIKDRKLYYKHQHPPSIYRNRSHAHLLNPKNLVRLRNTM